MLRAVTRQVLFHFALSLAGLPELQTLSLPHILDSFFSEYRAHLQGLWSSQKSALLHPCPKAYLKLKLNFNYLPETVSPHTLGDNIYK